MKPMPIFPDLTIARLHDAYAGGQDPAELMRGVLDAIAAADDPGIFITLVNSQAIEKAVAELGHFDPKEKPLWGVPFAVKDNIDVAGLATTAACDEYAYTPTETAFAVARLLDAGAILIGKTNLDQFATGLVGVRTPYPVPRNAIDPTLVPGGSSSGSAVAVARGLVSFALGTDTAGSGRVPAALNNIVGLKPSLGIVSTRGVVPACRTLDCVSIFGLTVDDAWRAFRVMAVYDEADPYAHRSAIGAPSAPPNLRIGVPSTASIRFFGDAHAEAAFEVSLRDLHTMGATIVEVDIRPFLDAAELLYGGPWVAERFEAIRDFISKHRAALHPVTRQIIDGATRHSAADAFAGQYRLAALRRQTEGVWRKIDALMVPTIPSPATRADLEADPIGPNSRLGTYTNFVNLMDLAALAVPGRLRPDGWPAGVTLVAPRGQDAFLVALGARLHALTGARLGATPSSVSQTPVAPTTAPAGWIELCVVGAHMSGLPLNTELTGLGGVFLREVQTESSYRLFALDGGPPKRPGLLRVASGEGHSIAAEVWALTAESFGRFVAAIPPPLGIGTLLLADGTTPKGFLVEPEATRAARDISSTGSWRSYLRNS